MATGMLIMGPLWKLRFVALKSVSWNRLSCAKRWHSTKISKPLRVLFCGSDEFSIESLRAIHAEHQRDPKLIASIDVLCRPGKRTGRAMKTIREVPLKGVAQSLGLPIHERDTFRGWDLPTPQNEAINLIIAVSFGLFVPPRILNAAEYGGLNVHPSLLPNFRGAAPLHHTIMAGEEVTGITVQTLDDKSFDNGIILAQTPPPGLQIPSAASCTYDDLLQFVKPKAAEMLIQTLRCRAFVPPLVEAGGYNKTGDLQRAPKVLPEDREIQWHHWDATIIFRRHRALQRLWNKVWIDNETEKRIIYEDIELVPNLQEYLSQFGSTKAGKGFGESKSAKELPVIKYFTLASTADYRRPLIYIVDGDAIVIPSDKQGLRVKNITLEGQSMKPAKRVMQSIGSKFLMYLPEKLS